MKSVQTKSGFIPHDMSVTSGGDLVYATQDERTVNIVENKIIHVHETIRLKGLLPTNIYSTSCGDVLVAVYDEIEECRVVRYSGSMEKQIIQFDSVCQPLYLSCHYSKNISENKNLDICFADNAASAKMVVIKAGELRFKYTGHSSTSKGLFYPYGIITDSKSHLLTSDNNNNNCIHILHQDGQFLRYIENFDLHHPRLLCVDMRDNLFVAEWTKGLVKKIKYL
ncbi:uncharacterized protein LOC134248208 [Saccostrea cucullata]|uniref:uncharacterized protein LOC134248208 n=1 Tax=Saccostrea cuccullata TaxID=36930 RepID=UPI002ED154CD